VHGLQVPAPLQTPPVHAVATGSGAAFTQVCVPVVQDVTPAKHSFGLSEQGAPVVQALQTPAPLQTPPVHAVAIGSGAAVLLAHVCVPVAQEVVPA
jgi:hypothetical protein